MRPALTRRLLVFAVCALGVCALYLAPVIADSPARTQDAAPPVRGTAAAATSHPVGPASTTARQRTPGIEDVDAAEPASARPPEHKSTPRRAPRSTAAASTDGGDRARPRPVRDVRADRVTRDTVTVRWSAPEGDAAVNRYRVTLNGFEVATTDRLEATVEWFNDDTDAHVFQVRAFDTAGNASEPSTSRLVTRPPQPTPARSTKPGPTVGPSTEPSTGPTATQPTGTSTPTATPPAPSPTQAAPSGRPSSSSTPDQHATETAAPGDHP